MKSLWRELVTAFHSFSVKQQLWLAALLIVFISSLTGLLVYTNNGTMIEVPQEGGELVEGILGTPRFINPLLSVSDADRDLTALLYSGLLRPGQDGELVPDLAESYVISDDARTYTFKLKKGLTFHDGVPLTADDIEFTILKAQDPLIKSARRAAWEGVSVEKISDTEISFHLKQPYAAFLENLTIGILPKHIWESITPEAFSLAEENVKPIGSGPFKLSETKFDRSGLPLWYALEPFENFALGKPKLTHVLLHFYPNEEEMVAALRGGEVHSGSAISPEQARALTDSNHHIVSTPFPRIFAVFFNQNENNVFTQQEVREALDLAVDKQTIIDKVLAGYGTPLESPLPPGTLGAEETVKLAPYAERLAQAETLLEKNGWTKNSSGVWSKKTKAATYTLTFSISAPNTPELKAAAELITKNWQAFGAQVDLKAYELGDLNQNIIRPRKYEALFFGEILGRDPDPFAFWHSSQRLDPGLNIALYTNITADKLLSDARGITNRSARASRLAEFEAEVKKDAPAVFVYAPSFVYVVPRDIKGLVLPPPVTPADRFASIYKWYVSTEYVWPFFKNL